MGDFKFPTNGPPGTIPGPPRDQDPNMVAPAVFPLGVAPPAAGDTWAAPPQFDAGFGRPGPASALPPPTPNGSRFGAGGPLPQGGPVYQPPVRQPVGPPMPQVKPQARPGGPGMTVSTGSMSRGFGGGTTPPVRQTPPRTAPNPGMAPPPYPTKYPVR